MKEAGNGGNARRPETRRVRGRLLGEGEISKERGGWWKKDRTRDHNTGDESPGMSQRTSEPGSSLREKPSKSKTVLPDTPSSRLTSERTKGAYGGGGRDIVLYKSS